MAAESKPQVRTDFVPKDAYLSKEFLQRENEKLTLRSEYLDRVRKDIASAKSGEALLVALMRSRLEVIKQFDQKNEAVRAELTAISYDLGSFQLLFNDMMRLVAGPYLSKEGIGARALLTIVLVGIAALLVMVLAALALDQASGSKAPHRS